MADTMALHEHWMRQALAAAECARAVGEVPIGAVLVMDERLVGRGHNQPIAGCDPTAHAEVVALRDAARCVGNYRLPGSILYVTLEPCVMCAGAALAARVDTVVYGAREPRSGAAGSVVDVLRSPLMNHRANVVGGVLHESCKRLLTDFFTLRR